MIKIFLRLILEILKYYLKCFSHQLFYEREIHTLTTNKNFNRLMTTTR